MYFHFRTRRQILLVLTDELLERLDGLAVTPRAYDDTRAAIHDMPGAAFSADLHYLGAYRGWSEAMRVYAPGTVPEPDVYRVTPGYFDAMQIPLEAGRGFTRDDDDLHPFVAIINETMAQALFPDEGAVGKRIWSGAGGVERTIVGVVGDTYQYGLDQPRTMQLYVPHADNSGGDLTLVVRTTDSPRAVESQVRDVVRSVDPACRSTT